MTRFASCSNNISVTKLKEGMMATAYCMKCRKKVEMRNPSQVVLKNRRPATRGVCPVCGTKVFRIGKA